MYMGSNLNLLFFLRGFACLEVLFSPLLLLSLSFLPMVKVRHHVTHTVCVCVCVAPLVAILFTLLRDEVTIKESLVSRQQWQLTVFQEIKFTETTKSRSRCGGHDEVSVKCSPKFLPDLKAFLTQPTANPGTIHSTIPDNPLKHSAAHVHAHCNHFVLGKTYWGEWTV